MTGQSTSCLDMLPVSQERRLPSLLLAKPDFLAAGQVAFKGGKHAFRGLARSLAAKGHEVTVLCQADMGQVLLAAMTAGGTGPPGVFGSNVMPQKVAQDLVLMMEDGCRLLVDTAPVERQPREQREAPASYLSRGLAALGESPDLVLLDADDCWEAKEGAGNMLLEQASQLSPGKLVLLVQNVHFLPFGPAGCGCCSPAVAAAWQSVSGLVCVSDFVAEYVAKHIGQVAPCPPVRSVSLSAFGVFGAAVPPDLGASVCSEWKGAARGRPVVVQLKLSDVKGAQIFFGLVRAMPEADFVAVCGEDSLAGAWDAFASNAPNVRLRPPGDIDEVLAAAWVVLCPSLWLEAFGMTAVDALLRGLPVLASNAGGLPEAKLGTAGVIPVCPVKLPAVGSCPAEDGEPPDAARAGGMARWRARIIPQQDLRPWCQALRRLLQDQSHYEAASRCSRRRAVEYVQSGPAHLDSFSAWLACLAMPD